MSEKQQQQQGWTSVRQTAERQSSSATRFESCIKRASSGIDNPRLHRTGRDSEQVERVRNKLGSQQQVSPDNTSTNSAETTRKVPAKFYYMTHFY